MSKQSNNGADTQPTPHLQVIPLGGMGEIGKNTTAFRYGDEILLTDAGMAFPDSTQPGIDVIVPRIDYLLQHAGMIKGLLLTHGHEDHIGGVPYLLARLPNIPVYGAKLTLGLVREKLTEFGIKGTDLREYEMGDRLKFGEHFRADMFRMTHSIPDNAGYVLHTPVGQVVHTGDFKLDEQPTDGQLSDLARLKQAGDEGVLLLLSDSTNAERMGRTPSETEIAQNLDALIASCRGRVFLTTFASQVHRLQNIINIAHKHGRRVVVEGRSMLKYISVATDLGIMTASDTFLTSEQATGLQDSQVLFLCTGSQGQPMSVMGRLASGRHSKIALKRGDSVIISSNPIPGNEEAVNLVINQLYEIGADVFYPPNHKVHASGHGSRDELAEVLELVRPKYFLPWHGEPRHQINHARLAQSTQRPPQRTLIARNGDIVHVSQDEFKVTGTVPAGAVYVDGLGVGDVSDDVLIERVGLAEDGVIVITVAVRGNKAQVDVVARGFARHNAVLGGEVERVARETVEAGLREKRRLDDIRDDVHGEVRRFVRKVTGRSPVLLPALVE